MPFCSNCGHKLGEVANFCPACGEKTGKATKKEQKPAPAAANPAAPEGIAGGAFRSDPTFTLLEAGSHFHNHFRIEKVLNKDNEGISYVVIDERENQRRFLKIYHQFNYDTVEKLFGATIRMSKIQAIRHPNLVKVYEVNQTEKPAYIVSEYIDGVSLAEVRAKRPEYLTEETVRGLAKTILGVTQQIRDAGLSIHKLEMNGLVLTTDNQLKLLSGGITYDAVDEQEDIHALGVLFAKLVSKSPFIETIYNRLRMQENKFENIPGVSRGFNAFMAECLHRNLNHRYSHVSQLVKALDNLKPLTDDEITPRNTSELGDPTNPVNLEKPKGRVDILFWSIAVVSVVIIGLMLTTNLMNTLFGSKEQPLKFTGFLGSLEDTTLVATPDGLDNYRNIRTDSRDVKYRSKEQQKPVAGVQINPDVNVPQSQTMLNPADAKSDAALIRNSLPAKRKTTMPASFMYLTGDTFAFGNMRKDSRANVSINSFYIAQTELTQGEWNILMKPVKCTTIGDNLPVDNITWYDAILYCNGRSDAEGLSRCYKISGFGESKVVSCDFKANGYRLPTEAEWEYAARANKSTAYSGSDFPDQIGWYKDNANGRLHPVKTKSANSFGLYDLTGNISEWVWDWYDINYQKVMPFINPTGPDIGKYKSVRGGDIEKSGSGILGVTARSKGDPNKAQRLTGFRLVRSK